MKPAAPVVSVILPVRDARPYLDAAIVSLLSQTLEDFELIAVDDGSVDGSRHALGTWAKKDSRVKVFSHKPMGIVATLERARVEASGRYMARMDADDVAEPRRLEQQLEMLEADPSLAGCGTGVTYFPAEVVRDGARRYQTWINGLVSPEDIAREIFVECPLAHPTFFFRSNIIDAVGGYLDQGWPEDYDLLLRLWAKGYRLGKVPDQLLRWREHADRLSRTDGRYSPASFLACKAHYLQRTLLRGMDGTVIWGAGPVGKAVARALLDVGAVVLAFVDLDPRKLGQEIYGAPVIDTESGLRMRGCLHLAAVGQEGARQLLRTTLGEAGLRELVDFAAVA
mgnify:FL=1